MATKRSNPHILVIPYPAPGHLLPTFNLCHKLALRGVKMTILISPKNLPRVASLLSLHPSKIQTLILPFPSHPSIPEGIENMQELPITYLTVIIEALEKLYDPVLEWFKNHLDPPVAILSGIFHTWWTYRLCEHLGIKRIGFTPTNAYTLRDWYTNYNTSGYEFKPNHERPHDDEIASWGFIFNSFDELEPETLEIHKKDFYKHERVWAVGPLLDTLMKKEEESSNHRSIEWLDSCHAEDKSVVYVGFGTHITMTCKQMEALANALENSGVYFVWSLKPPMKGTYEEAEQNVVPEGFEERTKGRGIIVKDWVPQKEILEHRAVGVYLTHCGWNSVLEALCAGVLLLGWPMQADHFYNATMMIDELGVGVRICEGLDTVPDSVELTKILANSTSLTGSEKIRAQVEDIRSKALKAIGEDGSSAKALDAIVQELRKL